MVMLFRKMCWRTLFEWKLYKYSGDKSWGVHSVEYKVREFSGITNIVCWKFELHFCTFMQIFDILLLFL